MQRTVPNPAREIAAFTTELSYDEIPPEAIRTVERAFIDTLGVMLAGATGDAAERACRTIRRLSGRSGRATVFTDGDGAPIHDAAFVNGIAGHWHDYDDVVEEYHLHPSVPLIAAILATAEDRDVDCRELIAAYVAGFESIRYLADPINPDHYERGWHATATYGTFGATAAVGRLLGLSADRLAMALNIAGSLPAGLKRNFGSMTKSFHAGNAASNGIRAAALAEEGYEATPDALVGSDGFYDLYRGDADPDFTAQRPLGSSWSLLDDGIAMKKYPCCYFTHASIEAVRAVSNDRPLDPEEIESVTVSASAAAKSAVIHDRPTTPIEGKFSMPYIIASTIDDGSVGLSTFTESAMENDEVRELMSRVSFELDPSLPFSSHAGTVDITLSDGTELRHHEERPPGIPANPLTEDELREKFAECASVVLDESSVGTLFERLQSLSDQPDIDAILGPIEAGR